MDIVGEAAPLADAELVAAAIDIMRAFGFGPGDVKVRLSDRRVLRVLLLGQGLGEEELPAAFRALDKAERAPGALEQLGAAGGGGPGGALATLAGLKGLEAVTAALGAVPGGRAAGEPPWTVGRPLQALGLRGIGAAEPPARARPDS